MKPAADESATVTIFNCKNFSFSSKTLSSASSAARPLLASRSCARHPGLAPRHQVPRKGGKAPPYEEWTKDDLYDRARELDIDCRSAMSKDELIDALRDQ